MTAPSPVHLHITGMTCSACVGHVTQALLAVEGVTAADVNLDRATAVVTGTGLVPSNLVAAVEEEGYGALVATGAIPDSALSH